MRLTLQPHKLILCRMIAGRELYDMGENHSNTPRDSKLRYEKPAVTRIGTLEDVTQHASSGHALDAGFGAGTPASGLTFSD
jgi:hypothetical protein